VIAYYEPPRGRAQVSKMFHLSRECAESPWSWMNPDTVRDYIQPVVLDLNYDGDRRCPLCWPQEGASGGTGVERDKGAE
jgi:hypothetical protein